MKVGRPRTLNHSRTTSLVIEEQTLADFAAAIGDKNVSEALREHMEAVVQEYKKEKNLMAPNENLGAIKMTRSQHTIQTTLDKYVPSWILRDDWQEQNAIQDQLTYDDQLLAVTAMNNTVKRFKSRLY
jgi:hypothetical protein